MAKKKYKARQCESDSPLGLKMKDKITGFEGIAIARTDYLYGCNQYHIKPQVVKDGATSSAVSFDYLQLEIVGKGVYKEPVEEPEESEDKPGGIHPDCPVIF